jgi:hypothetical protein
MQPLLSQLSELNRILAADVAAIGRDYAAMNAMADDIVAAVKRRDVASRMWSSFTPSQGVEP